MIRFFIAFSVLCFWTGCATNPVTGRQEVRLISPSEEIAMGTEAYPMQLQAAGGVYTLDPELTTYVKGVGQKLAAVSDRPNLPYEFAVVNDGSWNAWALPGGKIAINRGLLVSMESEAELAAVLGHEIVHAAARHSAKQMERGLLFQVGLIGVSAAVDEDWQDTALIAGSVAGTLGMLKYSRDAESESDAYGMIYMVRAGYHPSGAVELQERFAANKGSAGGWLATHPASVKRVKKNQKTLKELGLDGDWGRQRYDRVLARLREWEPAYKAYENGLKALSDKKTAEALVFADQAIDLLPQESLFFGLRGRAQEAAGNKAEALVAHSRAVNLKPDWFLHRLEKGLLLEKMGRKQDARVEIEASLKLLPTQKGEDALNRLRR